MSLQVTADSNAGDEARLIRNVEVAQIPVFQFGVFSDSDLSYFPGPNFDFAGRVQTNGNLFLAEGGGSTLTFHSPMRASGADGKRLDPDCAKRMRRWKAGLPESDSKSERRQFHRRSHPHLLSHWNRHR
jgi:hypothetical protein